MGAVSKILFIGLLVPEITEPEAYHQRNAIVIRNVYNRVIGPHDAVAEVDIKPPPGKQVESNTEAGFKREHACPVCP